MLQNPIIKENIGGYNMSWKEIIKKNSLKVRSIPTMGTDVKEIPQPEDSEDCNTKLSRVKEYIISTMKSTITKLETVVDDINENDPPIYQDEFRVTNLRGTTGEVALQVENHTCLTEIIMQVNGSWDYRLVFRWCYEPVPEDIACKAIEMYNSEASTDLNGTYDYDDENWNLNTKRKAGPDYSYANKSGETLISIADKGKGWGLGGVFLGLDSGYGYPYSYEIYSNIRDHIKKYVDAIDLKGIHEKIEQMLK